MPDEIDKLFGNIRRGAFPGNAYEEGPSNDNINPSGWYSQHGHSSFVGQANALLDPTFGTVLSSTPFTGSPATGGLWKAHYVLNSGSLSTAAFALVYPRGSNGGENPFNSGMLSFGVSDAGGTYDVDAYLYPAQDWVTTSLSTLAWMVASGLVYYPGQLGLGLPANATVTMEIYDATGAVVAASSPSAQDVLGMSQYSFLPLVASYTTAAATFRSKDWRWRLKLHVDSATGTPAGVTIYLGEPQIHFAFNPQPLPYQPQIGNWLPNEIDLSLTDNAINDVTSTKHGLAPKSPADATKFLNGAATPAFALVKDSDLSTSDITTNDVTSAKHGFMSKLPGGSTNFFREDGTWASAGGTSLADVQVFTVDGTWTKPTGFTPKFVEALCIGAGGGGGSGRKGASGTLRGGGAGGSGGGLSIARFSASDLSATHAVVVGASGAGGAGQSTDNTNGNAGSAGGDTTFGGTLIKSGGGGGGGGGLASSGAGTAGAAGSGLHAGGTGVGSPGSGGASGGGIGGGISGGDTQASGNAGGVPVGSGMAAPAGGAGGGGAPGAGTAPNSASASPVPGAGAGGSGGKGTSGNADTGGAGIIGSGGGGGGAALNAVNNSGTGGAGGTGICVVVTWG